MSDDSDIEEINVCRKGKRKIYTVNDSNTDTDDSQIINNNRRRRLPKVESESESHSDSSIVHRPGKNKKIRVVSSESSDNDMEEEDDSNCSTDNDSGASSYEESDEEIEATASTTQVKSNQSGQWSDSSDGQSEKCPICLLAFKTQDIGSPETCDHTFCVECIQEWSKNVNTCPVDRQEFTLILVRRELNGRVVRRIPVTPKQATDELMTGGDVGGVTDLTYCEICGQSDREDRMLLCDGCDLGYHMECLEPPLDIIPVDEWYCSDCSRDNAGPLADTVEIYDGEVDALIMEMEEIGGGRLAPRRRRLLPRTRQSERVRANIETQRHQQILNTPGPSTLFDDQPSTTSSGRNYTTATTSTSRNKSKKRKRRRRRRRTTGVVEYEVDEESGVKFTLIAKKRRRRKKKIKRLRRTVSAVPITVKRRLASQLGIYANTTLMKPKQVNNNILGFQRSQAGIATVDLFGNRNELDYFSDSDNTEGGADVVLGGSAGSSILARARPASAISLRPQHRHKIKTLCFPSPPAATTPCDILGSILDQQTKFLSKNAKISVGENGSVLIDAETNSKLPTQQKVNIQSSSSNSTTQVPMYPGYGNNGNRSSYGSSSFNNNRGSNAYNRGGGGGGSSNYGGNNYGSNSFRGRGGGSSGYSGNNQYDSRGDNNRYMDFLHRGPSSYQQSRGGPPFQRGRGAPRFPSTRRLNENNFQRNNYQFDQHSQQELDLSSSSGSNVQEHEISRSSETQHQSPPDTSIHPQDHTSSMMSTTTTSSYDEDANNDDLDIYSDIETKDTGTSSPSNEVVGSSAPTLVPPPLPPTLPGIVYGSDSDVNDSDTELVIDDTDKQDEGYDPAEPSAETDSEPDISTSSTTIPSLSQPAESEQIVASTSGEDEGKIIGPQLPENMRKLLINEETQQSLPPVNVVQPRIVHLQPKSVNEVGEDEDDSGDDDRCPNMSIYSSQNFANYDEDGRATLSNEHTEKKDDNDDNCPNFSIYSAESMGVAKVSDDDDSVIPITASVEAESSGDKPTESRDDEPDSVQNDEVESSTTDFEKDSISSLPLPPGPAPPPTVIATIIDEGKQEEPDSGVQNAEPDSNNMEKCEPELTDSENENQSEEISTTTVQKIEESSSSTMPAKKLPVKIDVNMKKDLDRKPTSSSSMRILQLYDDSDFEEWSEGGVPASGASKDKDIPHKDTSDNNVMAEIEKMTEAVSEEEERCYTPCMDEKKDIIDGNDRGESLGIGGLDTEMVSEDEKNDFDESHEIKTGSDGEALEINAKDHELDLSARPEDYEEGEIVEGAAKLAKNDPKPIVTEAVQEQIVLTDDNDESIATRAVSPTVKDKKKKSATVSSSFKKVSKNTKERNYRDKENRDRSKSKDKKSGKDRNAGIGDKKLKNKKKEKKKELERYDVRNIIGQRAKKDMFGRDETRHRSQSPLGIANNNRPHRSRKENSWDRSSSRSFTPPLSRNRRRTTVTPPPRRRKSSSRSLTPRTRRSGTPIVRGARRRSFSRRRSVSPRRRSLSNHRRSLTPPPTRRRSSGRSRSYSPRRNKRSLSRSRSYSPYRPRSTRRSRSPIHAKNRRKSRSRSRSIAPANKNRYRKQHTATKSKSVTKNKSKKNKKKKSASPDDHRSRLSLSATPPLHRNVDNPNITQTQTEWVSGGGGARYRRDWTPSWSRSPSPHQRIQRTTVQNISTWTPPLHYNDTAVTTLPSSPKLTVYLRNNDAIRKKKDKKKKSGEKRNKDVTTGKSKRRRIEQRQRTPPPSKEVFASGDNILVSVSFNKVNETDGNGVINVRDVVSSSGKRKRGDLDGDGSNKKKKTNKEKSKKGGDKSKKKKKDTSNIKPVAIIDLDKSPFKELTPSPRDVIVLSDSDNGEKEAELMERQEMLREELLEMGSQEENSVPQSPTENNYTSGPKTPPEPQIKFLIQKPTQLIRNVQNPLHDDQDDDDDDVGPEEDMIDPQEELELRLNEVMHKGPNTPPEPPSSPPSSPDVYDPFEPTKSRSPSPTEPVVASSSIEPTPTKATPPDIAESESSLVDLAVGPLEKPSTNVSGGTEPSPMQRVLSILNPKHVTTPEHSPTTPNTTVTVSEQDSQTRTTPEKSLDSNTIIVNNNATTPTTSTKTSITQPQPAIVKPMVSSTQQQTVYASQTATIMITSTPIVQSVAGQTRQSIFNNTSGVRSTPTSSSIPQRIVLPTTANKSSPTKVVSSTTKGPIKSTPIKPMQSKTIISKLPLPTNKPYVPSRQLKKSGTVQPQKQNNRNNNENGIEVIDVDLDFDSPYSPGSSDFEDLFEPPIETSSNNKGSSRQQQNNTSTTKNTKSPAKNSTANQSAFDSLFGNSPVYKPSTINTNKKNTKSGTAMKIPVKYDKKQKGSGKQVGVKLDEDSLKILDDLPSSAVELQVKNKFLKKLNRQERVVEEVKLVLKPHYNKKHVTKEQYKDILRRSVPKICHNKSGEINPKKIQCLIDAYVRKARIINRKNSGSTSGVTNSGVNNNNAVQTNSSMPQTLPKPTKTTFWS